MADAGGARRSGNIVQITGGVRIVEIESGGNAFIPQGQAADCGFDCARGAERVSMHGFRGAHGRTVSVPAERFLNGERFSGIVQRRGGSVRIDVINGLRGQARIFEGEINGAAGGFRVGPRGRHVMRVVGEPKAPQLSVGARAPAAGMLPLFQNQYGRALTHYESIAIAVEGAARALRLVIPGGKRANKGECPEAERRKRSFRTSRQHHVRVTPLEGPESVAYRDRPGGTRIGVGRGVPGDTELDGRVAAAGADEYLQRERCRYRPRAAVVVEAVLVFSECRTAQRAADTDAYPTSVLLVEVHSRIAYGHLGGRNGELGAAVEAANGLRFKMSGRVEFRHLGGDLRGKRRRVEPCDSPNARPFGQDPTPQLFRARADWGYRADSRDDDAPSVSCSAIRLMQFSVFPAILWTKMPPTMYSAKMEPRIGTG